MRVSSVSCPGSDVSQRPKFSSKKSPDEQRRGCAPRGHQSDARFFNYGNYFIRLGGQSTSGFCSAEMWGRSRSQGLSPHRITQHAAPSSPLRPPVDVSLVSLCDLSHAHTSLFLVSGIEHADKGSGGPCAGASSFTRPRSPGVAGQTALVLSFSQPSRVLTCKYLGPFGRGSSREACGPVLGSLVSVGCVRRAQPCRRFLRMETCLALSQRGPRGRRRCA